MHVNETNWLCVWHVNREYNAAAVYSHCDLSSTVTVAVLIGNRPLYTAQQILDWGCACRQEISACNSQIHQNSIGQRTQCDSVGLRPNDCYRGCLCNRVQTPLASTYVLGHSSLEPHLRVLSCSKLRTH